MRTLGLAVGLLLIAGCGAYEATKSQSSAEAFAKSAEFSAPPLSHASRTLPDAALPAGMGSMMMSERGNFEYAGAATEAQTKGEATLAANMPPSVPRKIIYSADIALVVEDFSKAQAEIPALVQKAHGYIAEQELLGSPGARRSARWKIRVPVEAFESFLTEIAGLGELERNSRTSQDITEQFADLDARVKNKKVEEERLQKILQENTGKIEDVLKVETELSRVRGEIEQMEGRLRLLDNLSALTTVSINVNEREKFQPPPPVAASFPTRLSRAFGDSWRALVETGESLALWFVAILPWLPLYLIGAIVAFFLGRWLLRWAVRNARRGWTLANAPIRRTPAPPAEPTA